MGASPGGSARKTGGSPVEQGSSHDWELEVEQLRRVTQKNINMSLEELDRRRSSHRSQFLRFGRLDDIGKAIEYATLALESTREDDPALAGRHVNLGNSYDDRFRRLGILGDLERAIEHTCRAVALAPLGDPNLPLRLGNLGISYQNRFKRLGEVHDLEMAIKHKSRALELTPDGHADMPDRHSSLGVSYTDRFRRMGEVHDLEKAIEHYSCALRLTPDGHPYMPYRHANLGVSYTDRFQRMREVHDHEKAIEHKSRALALTPEGHPDLPDRHASLGVAYTDRFRQLGEGQDIKKAIEHHSHALALTPDGHPDLPKRHGSLGVSYTDRFQRMGEVHDLEKAIEHDSCALELTPEGHPDLPFRHDSLGVSYTNRFQRMGEVHDLEKAIEHNFRAFELTPDGHPDFSRRHFNRAYGYILQYQHTKDQAHLESALYHYREASQLSTGSPRNVFQNALKWATQSARYSSLNPIEAYQTTIDLLPHFIWLGATSSQRYHDLSTAESLAINAAHAAILHSDSNLALEWLEHARCVVWNQTLMLRTPLDQLESSHPDLASHLNDVSKQLHEAGTQPSISQADDANSANYEQVGQNRRRLAREYSGLIVQVRTLPGFESFLLPMNASQLIGGARYGPIVVVNCHKDRSDALIILPGQRSIVNLPLPNFTATQAQNARSDLEASLRRKGLRDRGVKVKQAEGQKDMTESVLLILWTCVVKPLLEFLAFIKDVPPDQLPHITWCLTGPLSFLPLHAAGDYSQQGARVFNYVVSSYIPTVTSLLSSASSSLNSAPHLFAVSQTDTPGCTPLPGTARELELVKARAKSNIEYSEIVGNEATIAAVLHGMENHDWVHLACHAHQSVEDPNKSGFFLHDGILDLASINQQSFRNKGLAFLSACQTATGDEKLPDEAVHLASGMLMAGYTSVIATMWSVGDSDAPVVADKVYAQLMKDKKLGNGEAGRALHDAVGELREKVGEKSFWRWVPYIHIGS